MSLSSCFLCSWCPSQAPVALFLFPFVNLALCPLCALFFFLSFFLFSFFLSCLVFSISFFFSEKNKAFCYEQSQLPFLLVNLADIFCSPSLLMSLRQLRKGHPSLFHSSSLITLLLTLSGTFSHPVSLYLMFP